MAEWLILVLLVPAIVLPAVLLLGFAGCGIDRGGRARPMPPPPPPPMVPGVTIVSAEGISESVIELRWMAEGPGVASALFNRTRLTRDVPPERIPEPPPFEAPSTTHPDPGLRRATTYEYQARGVNADGVESAALSALVTAETLGFVICTGAPAEPFGSVAGRTVKCVIPMALLTTPSFVPDRMWIKLGHRADASERITFSRVYVGHQADPAGPEPWDAIDLAQVRFRGADGVVRDSVTLEAVPDSSARSEQIAFRWNTTSALVLSMYFAGGAMVLDPLSAQTGTAAVTYLKDVPGDEAAIGDTTGMDYTDYPGYLSAVVTIEVSD